AGPLRRCDARRRRDRPPRARLRPQPWDLTLGPERGETDAREGEHAVEHEEAWIPPRRELRREAVEALELEPAVAQHEQPLDQRPLDEPSEGDEVERQLFEAALAKRLDRANDEEFGQAVRGRPVAAHQ